MGASNRTVQALARRADLSAEFALELIRESGILVSRATDHVPPKQLHLAEAALDLIVLRPIKRKPAPPVDDVAKQPKGATLAPGVRKKLRPAVNSIVGRRQHLVHISYQMAEAIHWQLVEDFRRSRDPVEPPGIRSEDLLHSALTRCQTGLGADLKYPTPPMAAAALLHSMIHNHPFHNGNKRTALVALLVFLDMNGWRLHAADDELFAFLLTVAAHNLGGDSGFEHRDSDQEVSEISDWLHRRIRKIQFVRRSLKFHDLRHILLKHECTLSSPRRAGNRIDIRRGNLRCQVWYGGEGRDVREGMIPKIRRDLQLDDEHGYDEDIFYNAEQRLPAFVAKYRKILLRLAKT